MFPADPGFSVAGRGFEDDLAVGGEGLGELLLDLLLAGARTGVGGADGEAAEAGEALALGFQEVDQGVEVLDEECVVLGSERQALG